MKKLVFLIAFGIIILIPAKSQQDRIGFAGVSVPVSVEKNAGFGIEVATIKNNPGVGFQVEYIPEIEINAPSYTLTKFFLLWEVTKTFYIKSAIGSLQEQNNPDYIRISSFLVGIGPQFIFDKFYMGVQANMGLEQKGFFPSSLSFALGMKFE